MVEAWQMRMLPDDVNRLHHSQRETNSKPTQSHGSAKRMSEISMWEQLPHCSSAPCHISLETLGPVAGERQEYMVWAKDPT